MLNPMARNYQGYVRAKQSVLEEEDEEDDLEAGAPTNRRTGWRGAAAEMNILHPNIRAQDKSQDPASSDDEVPQSLMIEATSAAPTRKAKRKSKDIFRQPLAIKGRHAPPILPSSSNDPPKSPVSPKPSDIETPSHSPSTHPNSSQPKQMRGLDAYERALWNWVNVYNLDAFLQEVYYYYEGKGIYCIALSRGLNLLSVSLLLISFIFRFLFDLI
jgi:autophagy-related protein 9